MKGKNYGEYVFDFEKLEVYQLGLKFVSKVIGIVKKLSPTLRYSIGTNFIRAAISFVNNIAEGSGKRSKKDKVRFYGYSLNSIRECVPSITILFKEGQITERERKDLRSDCVQLGNMIVGLMKKIQ